MESLYLLIPLSVLLVFLLGALFWWAVRRGQFDDLEGPGFRVIMDDDRPRSPPCAVPQPTPTADSVGAGQRE